jgi:hypothetical protein
MEGMAGLSHPSARTATLAVQEAKKRVNFAVLSIWLAGRDNSTQLIPRHARLFTAFPIEPWGSGSLY